MRRPIVLSGRMNRTCFAVSVATVLIVLPLAASAQSAGPTIMNPSTTPSKKAPAAEKAVKACPEYGAGYKRLDNGTCVKIGGYIRFEAGGSLR
jgi:hypothetical protein